MNVKCYAAFFIFHTFLMQSSGGFSLQEDVPHSKGEQRSKGFIWSPFQEERVKNLFFPLFRSSVKYFILSSDASKLTFLGEKLP